MRDVIRLRNPTEDKRAFRRMLTSADLGTRLRKFISHLSIGSKAARDKVNQIAHVRKSHESLGTTNMAANRERVSAFGSKERLFSASIQIFQGI